jgi:hypothetical protein
MENHVIVHDFERFLRQVSGVKETTKHQYVRYVQAFLSERFDHVSEEQLSKLTPIDIIQYMMNQKRIYNVPTLKAITKAL